jgi:methionine synthase I (cobalamin-dependent)
MGIFQDIVKKTLTLDGAMGTMIQRHTLTEDDFRGTRFAGHHIALKGNNDLLCITRPDVIEEIHLQYFEAGADIVETNTFNAQQISMEDYALTDCIAEVNTAAVQCAKNAREQYYLKHGRQNQKYIAGAVGPTSKTTSLSPDVNNPAYRAVTYDQLHSAYFEQIEALIDAGIKGLVVAGTGNGSISQLMKEALLKAQGLGVAVCLSSRCNQGLVIRTANHAFETAKELNPAKARVALILNLLSKQQSHVS